MSSHLSFGVNSPEFQPGWPARSPGHPGPCQSSPAAQKREPHCSSEFLKSTGTPALRCFCFALFRAGERQRVQLKVSRVDIPAGKGHTLPPSPCPQAAHRIFPVNTPTTWGPAQTSPAFLLHKLPAARPLPPNLAVPCCRCRPQPLLTPNGEASLQRTCAPVSPIPVLFLTGSPSLDFQAQTVWH